MKQKIFERIVKDTERVLEDYEWEYNHETMELVVQKWATNKTQLREILSKHPYWIEEKQYIVFENDYERKRDVEAIENFKSWMISRLGAIDIRDYVPSVEMYAGWEGYNTTFYRRLIEPLFNTQDSFCSDELEKILQAFLPELRCKKGQKISRIVNKVCKKLGFDKACDYNTEYAKFADALNPIKYKRFTILSINPIDYLLSSNGNSWSSCHTPDVKQKYQSQFRGESCSGTMSYMLDKTSFVMYTIKAEYTGKDYELEPKVNRQMYQYGDYKLLQGRLYPQCNDGQIGDDLRTDFRNIVQKVIADCLEEPNLWTLRPSTSYNATKYYHDVPNATHYPDYLYDRNQCTLSFLKTDTKIKKFAQEEVMYIGSMVRCIVCGKTHDQHGSFYCSDCASLIQDESEEDDDY